MLADKADTVRIIRELRFLRLLQHPNIIAVHDVLLPSRRKDFDAIFIVFERLDTDLAHLIRSKTKYEEVHIQVRYEFNSVIPHAISTSRARGAPAVAALPTLCWAAPHPFRQCVPQRSQTRQHSGERELRFEGARRCEELSPLSSLHCCAHLLCLLDLRFRFGTGRL